ncbi:hypothetical protein [Deinococcus daejeonensis]|uniref:Uncharacterized protein n=1 Tax=Deinococcus daejeonensis TaxID=1007098 RepID=A0ABQ2IZ02_9DEIO|nr:hypothetical protein [Deinococcus daejeonensis]GGN32336.1 hypothetical protein GCM10010842_08940 [Deinococcus daejeonensis]
MNEIPTAEQAAAASDQVRAERNRTYRERCLHLLNEAMSKGARSAVLPSPLPADLEQELLKKGYWLRDSLAGPNEYEVLVTW